MKKMRILAAVPLALVFLSGGAWAADLSMGPAAAPMARPPVTALLFTGLNVGVQGGGGWASSNTCVQSNDIPPYDYGCAPFDPGYNTINMSGPYIGGHIGYDFAISPAWRLGVEGDFNWAGITGKGEQYWSYSGVGAYVNEKIDSFGTLNARVGYVMGNWMPYVTGGLAFGHGTRDSVEEFNNFVLGSSSGSASHTGWDIGAGVEWAINQHWSVKAEYKYIDLGRANYHLDDSIDTVLGIAAKVQTAEFGVSYRF